MAIIAPVSHITQRPSILELLFIRSLIFARWFIEHNLLVDQARTGIPYQLVEPLLLARHAEKFLEVGLRWGELQNFFLAYPWFRVRLGSRDGHVDFQGIAIHAVVTLLQRHVVAHRIPKVVEPGALVKAQRLY